MKRYTKIRKISGLLALKIIRCLSEDRFRTSLIKLCRSFDFNVAFEIKTEGKLKMVLPSKYTTSAEETLVCLDIEMEGTLLPHNAHRKIKWCDLDIVNLFFISPSPSAKNAGYNVNNLRSAEFRITDNQEFRDVYHSIGGDIDGEYRYLAIPFTQPFRKGCVLLLSQNIRDESMEYVLLYLEWADYYDILVNRTPIPYISQKPVIENWMHEDEFKLDENKKELMKKRESSGADNAGEENVEV